MEGVRENLPEEKKVCKGCGRELPLSCFKEHNKSSDGHMSECNDCRRRKLSKKEAKVNPLATFTARELMLELRNRGYEGTLEYTEVHKINLGTLH